MTSFGTDRSHHNGVMGAAAGHAIVWHTHKLTDGDHYFEDPAYKAATDRARGYGVPVLGAYHVLWGNKSLSSQADWFVARATALTPYWASMPWVWQPDCESFGYNGLPTIDQINSFGDMVCARAHSPAESYMPYAPAWVYGAALKGLRYRNYWASNYGPNPAVDHVAAYPGDGSTRWNAAAIPAVILQYGSTTTDLGDANAYRGSVAQFLTTIKATGTPAAGAPAVSTLEDDDMKVAILVATSKTCYLWWLGDDGPHYLVIDRMTVLDQLKMACGNPPFVQGVDDADIAAGRWGTKWDGESLPAPVGGSGPLTVKLSGTVSPGQ